MKRTISVAILIVCVIAAVSVFQFTVRYIKENKILKEVISRLEADSRIAEALVTNVYFDETSKKTHTTIKFLEYDSKGSPLTPMYFTFPGNIIQFESLVIRFDDIYIRNKDAMKGKSAYLFWKVFMLDGKNTMEYDITKLNEIPAGYKIQGKDEPFEKSLWAKFWSYALNPKEAKKIGIKNAQIEAPGTMFIPGTLYTIKIEHDGGIRIDAAPLPEIIKGEKIPE
ncbi:MAG: hypothetical protein PHI86_03380 [Candidatus Omnitrophica bacterium]|nr:hypothetical protein [Candidatus Omnitrophota bacterium]HOX54344.1 hypothetical protein [Candidatus Omnitrophota bacterium]